MTLLQKGQLSRLILLKSKIVALSASQIQQAHFISSHPLEHKLTLESIY